MKKKKWEIIIVLSIPLLMLSCHGDYYGEPFSREEMVINGELYSHVDYGEKSYFSYVPTYEGICVARNKYYLDSLFVFFGFSSRFLELRLTPLDTLFVEDKVYDVIPDPLSRNINSWVRVNQNYAKVVAGTYRISRKYVNQYAIGVLYFDFDCMTESGELLEVRNGILEICRRYGDFAWYDPFDKSLLKKEQDIE